MILASGAAVGDLIKVKAVDASGKPTAWAVAVAGHGLYEDRQHHQADTGLRGDHADRELRINWQYE